MATIDEKRTLILDSEYQLANRLALEIMPKPQLSVWMILIPIIFIYYFYELNRYGKAKKEFVRQFVKSRKLLLDEACSALTSGIRSDFLNLVGNENVPDCAKEEFRNWAKVLSEHYLNLLKADGASLAELIQASYQEQQHYLTAIEKIAKVESRFYKALQKDLDQSVENVGNTIFNIEKASARLRREAATSFFSSDLKKNAKTKTEV